MKIETTLGQMRDSYNWESALSCAFRDDRGVLGDEHVSNELFTFNDVASVLASSEGENDGSNWIALFKLQDGRYAFVAAWCDYTGWG